MTSIVQAFGGHGDVAQLEAALRARHPQIAFRLRNAGVSAGTRLISLQDFVATTPGYGHGRRFLADLIEQIRNKGLVLMLRAGVATEQDGPATRRLLAFYQRHGLHVVSGDGGYGSRLVYAAPTVPAPVVDRLVGLPPGRYAAASAVPDVQPALTA